jgi:hypothetical protein
MEGVAESLGAVSISIVPKPVEAKNTTKGGKGRKWVRHKESKPRKSSVKKVVEKELGKRSLMDVVVAEGTLADIIREEKKKKGDTVMEDCIVSSRTVVLEDQHRQEP